MEGLLVIWEELIGADIAALFRYAKLKTEFMSNVLQITPRLWQLKMGMVNSFLLKTDDGLLLIDSGWPNKTEKIFAAVRESGHNPAGIRHLVLTHGHIDHAGSAAGDAVAS